MERSRNVVAGAGVAGGRAPLWVVVTITWLASVSTGAAINGIYFVTEREFAYGDAANLALALVIGVAYIGAASSASRVSVLVRRWSSSRGGMTQRRMLGLLVGGLGISCFVPVVWPRPEAVWGFSIVNSVLSGWLWPLVESYVSGGRRGAELRRATGAFNVSWASAVAASFWLMQPLLAWDPMMVLAGLGCVLLFTLLFVPRLTAEAAAHGSSEPAHTDEELAEYTRLLRMARALLLASYVLMSVVTPVLPRLTESAGVMLGMHTLFASSWMVSRVVMFVVMQATHRWHGRRSAPMLFGLVLAAGCIGCFVSGDAVTLGVSLCVFGAGLGAVYAVAIYYALEVGAAEVDAGGRHEATIGVGYAGGPLLGLIAIGASRFVPGVTSDAAMVVAVLIVMVLLGGAALRSGRAPVS